MQLRKMMGWFLLMVQLLSVLRIAVGLNFWKPNCVNQCGDVKIPYPFGIGADCYHNKSYEITCNMSSVSPKPFLQMFNLEVLDIQWPGRYSIGDPRLGDDSSSDGDNRRLLTVAEPRPNLCGGSNTKKFYSQDLKGSPYRFSLQENLLMVEGCGNSAAITQRDGKILAECGVSVCGGYDLHPIDVPCTGVSCCQSLLQAASDTIFRSGLDYYEIDVFLGPSTNSTSCNASIALISYTGNTSLLSTFEMIPITLQWNATSFPQTCNDDHTCVCPFPYEGYPFLPNGCQVVQACQTCKTRCEISYNATGDYSYYHCKKHLLFKQASFLAFFIGGGVVLLALGSYWLYRFVKRKREIKQKAKHFNRNGGLLLQQQMSSDEGIVEIIKVFTVNELEKATDNFNDNRILGQGSQGMVYKGMLMDGKIVAIKTAKNVDENQVEQFINEVVILSQINHRNVVKLLGCCLETKVPILVYEFIPNGTLYELIHDQGQEFHLNWKMRLQIAAESAGAVAYLHSSSSSPIYHRDIKSTNILLDEKYRAKVSDFGTSKAINIDQTHVTTVVLGTYGYLDPEYFQSHQFTEKSDVYSFGVVLVELITGKKPICPTGNGGWINLATEFLTEMEEDRVLDMLDARIVNEGKEDEFMAIAEIARKCLNMNGKQRPTMKEIAVYLDGIRSSHIPIIRELGPVNSNQDDTDGSPFGTGVFSSEDDPLARSIEVQSPMDTEYFTANVV